MRAGSRVSRSANAHNASSTGASAAERQSHAIASIQASIAASFEVFGTSTRRSHA
jgi:hypothetical protein